MHIRSAFTLIEVMIAIAIIALVMAIAVPQFRARTPRYEREQFIAQINGITQVAWQHALTTQTMHKVVFDFQQREAWVEYAREGERDKQGNFVYERLESWYAPVIMRWTDRFKFRNFIIEGFDELARSAERKTARAYFFIAPEGLGQVVTINVTDTKDPVGRSPRQIGMVMNPFHAQFEVYDAFAQ